MDPQTSFNTAAPTIMHIDLNSCFATIEQQAHPHLRGKPVVVAAYNSPKGFILSNSAEAKKAGVKSLMRVQDARLICPDIIVRTPDTTMIRDVHMKFRKIFSTYSDKVIPKSIDEAILDFTDIDTQQLFQKNLVEIAKEIKQRMRAEIGEWITCSVGISTNRFLAKTGASLTKPDGLNVITHKEIQGVLRGLELIDLNGIGVHNQARLNAYGIFTPLQFLDSSANTLIKQVFESIYGYYWFRWLRGWEEGVIQDDVRKSYGQQYALGKPTNDHQELAKILMKLCEKMGRRLRRAGFAAKGIHVSCRYADWTDWHKGKKMDTELFTTLDLYRKAQIIMGLRNTAKVISKITVSCFNLVDSDSAQSTLFDTAEDLIKEKMIKITGVLDGLNDKYGEFTVVSGTMMEMDDTVVDRIAFGGVREIELLYAE